MLSVAGTLICASPRVLKRRHRRTARSARVRYADDVYATPLRYAGIRAIKDADGVAAEAHGAATLYALRALR